MRQNKFGGRAPLNCSHRPSRGNEGVLLREEGGWREKGRVEEGEEGKEGKWREGSSLYLNRAPSCLAPALCMQNGRIVQVACEIGNVQVCAVYLQL